MDDAQLSGGYESNPDATRDEQADPARWPALAVCLLVVGLTIVNISMVNVALPSIVRDLQASPGQQQWIVNAYSLTFILVLVPAGRLGDSLGRRVLVLVGLAFFGAGSLACGFAGSAWGLVAARLLQGLGSGMLLPQVPATVQTMFTGHERSRAFGYFGLVNSSAAAIGPLMGGVVLAFVPGADSWRWAFWINLPFVIVASLGAARLLPHSGHKGKVHLDIPGALLLGLAVLLVLGALQETKFLGLVGVAAVLVLAAIAMAAFVRRELQAERRGKQALAPPSLFRHRSFSLGVLVGFLFFAGWTSVPFILSIYLQSGRGYSALLTGAVQLPLALGGVIAAPLSSRYVDVIGRRLVVVGLGLVVVGVLGAAVTVRAAGDAPALGWLLLPSLLVAGAGAVTVISPNSNLTLASVSGPDAGSAGGVAIVVQRVGGSAGIAAIGSAFYALVATAGPARGASDGLIAAAVVCALGAVPALLDRSRSATLEPAQQQRGREDQHAVRAGTGS